MQLVLSRVSVGLAALLAACSGGGDKTDDTATPTDSGDPSDTADIADLPDVTADLDTEGCEEVSGSAVPGAVSYFVGTYWQSGEDDEGNALYEGEERWLLFANEAWQATGVNDCVIRWTATGSAAGTGACGTCDLGMAVSLQVDATSTDCPEDLWGPESNGTATYGLALSADTEAKWYYASSGSLFGSGYYADTTFNFVTEKACKWF